MKPVKFIVLAAAAICLLGVFALPYIKAGDESFTLWKLRGLEGAGVSGHAFIILIASLISAVLGGLAVAGQKMARWQTIITMLAFGFAALIALAVFSKTHTKFGHDGAIGAKLMVLALVAGAGASLVNIVKPDRGAA